MFGLSKKLWREIEFRQNEVRLLNRALMRKGKRIKNLNQQNRALIAAAINLRLAQRRYMAAKAGNVELDPRLRGLPHEAVMQILGADVGTAANILDTLLPLNYHGRMSVETQVTEKSDG